MMSFGATGVVVWECQDLISRQWKAYMPHVSDFIEDESIQSIRAGAVLANASYNIPLHRIDQTLKDVVIDLGQNMQIRGSQTQPIRRSIYPMNSPPAVGVDWQWYGDARQWISYDMQVQCILESAKNSGIMLVDLSQSPCCIPYQVDLVCMCQIRPSTGFKRHVQRSIAMGKYTKTAPLSSSQSSSTLSHVNGALQAAHTLSVPQFNSQYPSASFNMFGGQHPMHHTANGGMLLSSQLLSNTFGSIPNPFLIPSSLPMNGNVGMPGLSAISQSLPLRFSNLAYQQPSLATNISSSTIGTASNKSVGRTGLRHSAAPTVSGPTTLASTVSSAPVVSATGSGVTLQSTSKPGARTRSSSSSSSRKKHKADVQTISNKDSPTNGRCSFEMYMSAVDKPPAEEDCCICCDSLSELSGYEPNDSQSPVVQLITCKHIFHRACLVAMYNSSSAKDGSLQCPTCKKIYGVKCGDCPDGTMTYCVLKHTLAGYPTCDTIRICYSIDPGIQGPNHPHPGKPYNARGFPRLGYLPDNDEGQKVLRLLIKAWSRRLTFTIGTSVTTGETDTVVWNEIHHKTDVNNTYGHGYPDPNYINNVLAELSAQGVTDEADDDKAITS